MVVRWAAAGGLVAHVDGAVPPVGAVVLAGLQVAVGPREALQAPAGGVPWERKKQRLTSTLYTENQAGNNRQAEPGGKIRLESVEPTFVNTHEC